VGAHVARVLVRERCDVHALLRPGTDSRRLESVAERLTIVHADLHAAADMARLVERTKPDACVHLAWCTQPGEYLESAENVDLVCASARLALLLESAGCRRFVAAGTCFEYDTSIGTLAESSPILPATRYAAAKHALHVLLEGEAARGGLSVAWLRLFYLYGPHERPARLVPSVVRSVLEQVPARLTSGEQVRDFLHVEDAAEAFWCAIRSRVEGAVNVGSGKPVTVRHVAETVARIVGRPDLLLAGALPTPAGDPQYICADNSRLTRDCGWHARYDLETGLRHTIDWWRTQIDADGTAARTHTH
jgi:nucleoside-diphosphate-sugar epimerase